MNLDSKAVNFKETRQIVANFQKACQDGNLQVVQTLFEKVGCSLNDGLYHACLGGHLQIAKFMIEHGANYWNFGLYGACRGGHLQLVQLMIQKGANDWNGGLANACQGKHESVVQLMIEKGASSYEHLPTEQVYWLLEIGTPIHYFETNEKIKTLLQDMKTFRQGILTTDDFLLLPELLNLVSEYSLK